MQCSQSSILPLSPSVISFVSSLETDDYLASSPDYILNQVLSNPKLLCEFEYFLRQTWSHENLLFIEAISQLKHELDPKTVENTLNRIYKTFLARGSPLELNVTTQDQIKQDMRNLEWAIIDKNIAVSILQDTENQVLDMLKSKLAEFIKSIDISGNMNPTAIQSQQVSVVIIGGGFTGFTVASILDQMPRFYVTLIDTKDSFEYTPGIVRKIINPDQTSSLRVRHDSYVKNGRVIIGYAENLANEGKTITVKNEVIHFDYLVIATGSSYSSQLKSTDTSSLYRMSGLEESYLELLNAKKVLIIGGGLVGCELASEIAQHQFPGTHPKKEITLIDSHESVVHRSDTRQQTVALKYLKDLNVQVILNERILNFDHAHNNIYQGSSGRTYSGYDKIFIATGTRPNSSLFATSLSDNTLEGCLDTWERIKVRPTLQIQHYKYNHIFAGGDVTNVIEEKTGYAATISGVCIARNICRLVKGKTPLKQGTKGTLPAPDKPLHGILEHGGIGKQNLNMIKKKFSFLNPSWAALKYFDEQQFLKIVQGQGSISLSHVLGKLPRKLDLPSDPLMKPSKSNKTSQTTKHSRSKSCSTPLQPLSSIKTDLNTIKNSSSQSQHSVETKISNSSSSISAESIRSTNTQSNYHGLVEKATQNKERKMIERSDFDRNISTTTTAVEDSYEERAIKSLNGLVFEHFTYGGEDIQLFDSQESVPTIHSVSNCDTSKSKSKESTTMEMKPSNDCITQGQRMAYDCNFQLSPPPRRKASVKKSYKPVTCYDSSVKFEKSDSQTSIIQTI